MPDLIVSIIHWCARACAGLMATLFRAGFPELAQPWFEVCDVKRTRLEHLNHLRVDLRRNTVKAPVVDSKKHVGGSKGDPFIPVHERVIDGEAFHQRGSFGDDVIVITSLRPKQGRLQGPRIAQTRRTALTLHQYRVHTEHIGQSEEIARHGLLRQLAIKLIKLGKTRGK